MQAPAAGLVTAEILTGRKPSIDISALCPERFGTGDTTKAQCDDCHGAHDILRTEDPRSRLHSGNIVGTCAQCHPRAHERFTGYLTHANHHDRERYPGLYYAFWGMTALLVGQIVKMSVTGYLLTVTRPLSMACLARE